MNDDMDDLNLPSFDDEGGLLDGCKAYTLINETLLAEGQKENNYLAWLWNPNLFLQFTPIHHISFQVSQCCLLFLFLLPNSSPNRRLFRLLGIAYSASFLAFGFFVFKSLDMMTWAAVSLLVNSIHLLPKPCPPPCSSHSKELEQVNCTS